MKPLHHFLPLVFCWLAGFDISARADLTAQQALVPLEEDSSRPELAKVVLIAGAPSNKPGQHEYFAGCAMMCNWLKSVPGVWPVMVADGWPKNEAVLDRAKVILCYMDGGEKLALLETGRWARLRELMAQGTGLIMLHQAVEVPQTHADEFKSWLGGVWQKDIGSRGHWDMTFPELPFHEVTRGVVPFAAARDGWLFNLHFVERGVMPLLAGDVPDSARSTADASLHHGRPEVIAWAYERPQGGRSVGFTGCDLHQGWSVESQRRFLLNAILWCGNLEVPPGGVTAPWNPEDLEKNLDRKIVSPKKKPLVLPPLETPAKP